MVAKNWKVRGCPSTNKWMKEIMVYECDEILLWNKKNDEGDGSMNRTCFPLMVLPHNFLPLLCPSRPCICIAISSLVMKISIIEPSCSMLNIFPTLHKLRCQNFTFSFKSLRIHILWFHVLQKFHSYLCLIKHWVIFLCVTIFFVGKWMNWPDLEIYVFWV